MNRIGIALFMASAAPSLWSCAPDACEGAPPALELRARSDVAQIASLVVTIGYGDARYQMPFDVGDAFADGIATMAVDLAGTPGDDFDIQIDVVAFSAPNGSGEERARASETFKASPDACNTFELDLTPTTPVPDGGTSDAGMVDGGDPRDAGPRQDGGDAGPDRDAGFQDGGPRDGGPPDGGPRDAGPRDAGPRDAGQLPCPIMIDGTTVALYRFESNADDETTAHDGTASGGSNYAAGPAGCGDAAAFGSSASVSSHIAIPDSPAFDLDEGAVEATVRVDSAANNRTRVFFSRNSAVNVGAGELTIAIACDGTIVATLEDGAATTHRCTSSAIGAGQYTHVGVNFGAAGFELYVDGVRATHTGAIGYAGVNCSGNITCGGSTTGGISGNADPIVIGASNELSNPGTTDNLTLPFRDGRIDSLRISRANRSF